MSAFETIVIGVGTDLRGDDGFGGAVIEALRKQPALRDRALLARCDGEPARMIDLWEGFRYALVIDAVRGGSERFGFVYRHDFASGTTSGSARQQRETAPGGEPAGNGHAIGLGAAVRLGRVLDRLPGRLILYAVHGRDFRLGAPLSGPVAQAVPALAGRISREVLGVLSLGEGRDQGPGARRSSGPVRVLPPRATLRA
ncbi:hydrogenase maturation protease [Actinocrinis sp.]|uniref:hydrogenase maturation protease n=1 Tax=Actinocrinis sp. TaxID=1920516 RepID=UPI002D510D2C|nr:hydrogenase maturation protease [Actinocrinis sp.]HZP53910.1 hydrogenase maturation protease [Actinocrinis sp.]